MKILFITHRFPHPPNRGDRIRSFHFLKRFSEMGSVTLATFYEQTPSAESQAVLESLCSEIVACRWEKRRKWLRAGRAFLCGKTMTEGFFHSKKFQNQLRKYVQETKFDRIVIFCSSMFQYADLFKGTPNETTPLLVDLVDVDSQKWFDYAAHTRGLKKYIFQKEGFRLRQLELKIGRHSDALTAVTPAEIELYRKIAEDAQTTKDTQNICPLFVVPNGVDTQYFDPERHELAAVPVIPERLVFVGALDYRANIEGVEWFVKNVFLTLHERFPTSTFELVGSRPTAALKRLAAQTPGVLLAGTVPDVRPYLKQASVVVVPLQVGRGLQNKVLEACSMNRPTVVSTCAAEGIEPETQAELRICRHSDEWFTTLSELFQNSETREKTGRNGRQKVLAHYSWNVQLNVLESLLNETVHRN